MPESKELAIRDRVYEIVGVKRGEKLPSLAWPGLYTILYSTNHGDEICGECANKYTNDDNPIVTAFLYQEGPVIQCYCCGKDIESDYDDDDSYPVED